jgi:transcriptional antiterminator RfaH
MSSGSVSSMQRWYLIHTKPSSELVAETNLQRQGYEIYLPRLIQSSFRGSRQERVVPLFPRYLFLRLSEGLQSLGPIRSSVGVAGVVRFGSSYAVVADGVLNSLRARGEQGSGFHRLAVRPPLRFGTRVRVTSGLFDGLEGVFERESGADRVVLLLKLLGQDARVCVSLNSIQPTGTG